MFDNFKRKAMALLLSLAMIITYMPASMIAYAEGVDDQVQVEQQAEAEAPAEDVEAPKAEQPEEKAPAEDVEAPKAEQPEEKASEEVKSEEAKPDEAKSEEAAPAEKKASKASEDAAKPADEEAKEDAKAKVEDKEPIVYTEDLETVAVKVTAPADAFSENVKLVVKPLEKNSDEFKEAEEALAESKQTYDGILAFDIHFENANKKEIEPEGTVSVEMTAKKAGLKELDPDAVDSSTFKMVHIGEEAEVVADTFEFSDVDGTVDVNATSKAFNAIDVAFEVESFSAYLLIWGEEPDTESATIHWVTDVEGGYEELTTPTTIDSTASNVDINIILDAEKYYFIGADYKLSEDAEEVENLKSTVLKKEDGVWKISLEESGTVAIANGSHIYVHYAPYNEAHPYTPPTPPTPETLAPETTKTVEDNGNGTYTITLDVLGKSDHSTTKVGANVIVIMDVTQSMTNNMSGGGTRMAAAKQAVRTLIDVLDPDTNLINFRAINFGDNRNYYPGINWTTSEQAMLGYANGLPDNPNDFGTCWQAGLRGGHELVGEAKADDDLKNNATYVLFVTDGNPNCYAANNDGTGTWTGASGPGYNTTAYNRAAYWANILGSECNFYGIFCGSNSDAQYLRNLVSAANGNDDNFVVGSSADEMQSHFNNIAQTIVNNLGAGGVTIDDGIPTLSNVSANVSAGDAGGFTYYIKPPVGAEDFIEWDDAPGASYSQTNGVTWDLGEVGELQNGTIYRLKFIVWPSQKAYDTIADLNNGLIEFDDLTDEQKASVAGSKDTGYTLKTNTHLYTNFTDMNGQTFGIVNDARPEAMPLPTETISVEKLWHNYLDSRSDTDIDGIQLVLNRDDEEYLEFDVSAPSWKKDDIYISCGQIVEGEIKETGHDYYVTEKPKEDNDKTEYWEVDSPKYHPMVVDGTMKLFIQDDNAETPAFELKGHKYVSADDTSESLVAVNERVSWLNLTKANVRDDVAGHSSTDTSFEYTVKITEPTKEGEEAPDVYFSVFGDGQNYRDDITTSATKWVDEATGNTYYVAKSGEEFTLEIKEGWNARFLNLASGTTYSIQETNLPEGYALDTKDDSSTTVVEKAVTSVETLYIGRNGSERVIADGYPKTQTSNEDPVTGKINQNNTDYSVSYRNVYDEVAFEATKIWDDESDKEGLRPTATEFKSDITLYQDGEEYTGFADEDYTITDNGENNTYTISYAHLPKYVNGEEVTYTIKETTVPDNYKVSTTDAVENGGSITNTCQITEIKAKKEWQNADGTNTPPEGASVVFTLYADGSETSNAVTLNGEVDDAGEAVSWEATFSGLPKYADDGTRILYTVKETGTYSGYTPVPTTPVPDGGTIINNQVTKTVEGSKIWNDGEETGSRKPITLEIMNGVIVAKTIVIKVDGTCDDPAVEITKNGNTWNFVVKNLPRYATTGEEIAYTIVEQAIAGYETSYSEDNTITNTLLTTIEANKEWLNADGTDTPPEGAEVVFTLLKNNKATEYTVTLNGEKDEEEPTETGGYESEAWKATFVKLPKYDENNKIIEYTVEETGTYPGYTPDPTTAVTNGGTITNKQESTEVKVTKEWLNADGTTTAPSGASVTFTLYADGTETKTVTLDGTVDTAGEAVAWEATFSGLAKYKADGKTLIEYTVKETGTYPGYTPNPTTAVTNGGKITNEQDKGSVKITKTFAGLPEGADTSKLEFSIKVGDAQPYPITYADFKDGAYTIENIPVGTTVSVTETNAATLVADYTLDATSITTGTATVETKDQEAVIALSNVYTHANLVISKEINKLVSYDSDEEVKDATFTFRIVGKDAAGQTVLNTVAAVMFNASTGTSTSETIEKIPANITEMTVTEIDSGNYDVEGAKVQPATRSAEYDDNYAYIWTVSFKNKQKGGDYESGAINKYKKTTDGYVKYEDGDAPTTEGGAGDNGQN